MTTPQDTARIETIVAEALVTALPSLAQSPVATAPINVAAVIVDALARRGFAIRAAGRRRERTICDTCGTSLVPPDRFCPCDDEEDGQCR